MRVRSGGALITLLALVACRDRVSPLASLASPGTPTTPLSPAPTVTALRVSGPTSFVALAATGQMAAIATMSDLTTKDVTSEGRWVSTNPEVVTVSSTGLVTSVGFGVAGVSIVYESRSNGSFITVTPSGTYVASGRVREPGLSGLADVRIFDLVSGRSTASNPNGDFWLIGLAAPGRLRFDKTGYEQPSDASVKAGDEPLSVPLQRVIRITPGETVDPPPLSPHDLSYTIDSQLCQPCRRVRAAVGAAGTLAVRVNITLPFGWPSVLFAAGRTFTGESGVVTADIPVSGPGEIVMHFGLPGTQTLATYHAFKITASMR